MLPLTIVCPSRKECSPLMRLVIPISLHWHSDTVCSGRKSRAISWKYLPFSNRSLVQWSGISHQIAANVKLPLMSLLASRRGKPNDRADPFNTEECVYGRMRYVQVAFSYIRNLELKVHGANPAELNWTHRKQYSRSSPQHPEMFRAKDPAGAVQKEWHGISMRRCARPTERYILGLEYHIFIEIMTHLSSILASAHL